MKSVLIIDDEVALLEIAAESLTHSGYHVVTATGGLDGVRKARQHLPDLILCDINMPDLDGLGVLKLIRADPDLVSRQFVLMTGNPLDVTPRNGMELGADDFLIKPFGHEGLSRCVAARLARADVHWRMEDKVIASLRHRLDSVLPHEFYTPLNGVLGFAETLRLRLPKLDQTEIVEMVCQIEIAGWQLHRTLRNYLLLLESDRSPEPRAVDPLLSTDRINEAITTGIETALRRFSRADDLRQETACTSLRIDDSDLAMMVEELVDNACRFSRQGTPISVRLDASGTLTVTDNGRGMTPEQLGRIGAFQQFERHRFEQQGLGLGLCLVQRLAQRHRGKLSVTSKPGHGTAASISLPTT